MHKSSSHSSRGSRPDANKSFKPKDSARPYNKDSKPFKKNYDGRKPAEDEGRPSRPGKPYSGRSNDSDGPRKSFDRDRKDSFRPDGEHKRPFARKDDSDHKPFGDKKEGTGRPYPKKDFGGESNDRPRKSFDKPFAKRGEGNDGGERRPFGDRKEGSARPFPKRDNSDDNTSNDRPRRSFDKPYAKRGEGNDAGERRPYSDRKETTGRPFAKRDNSDGDAGNDRPRKTFDKPYVKRGEGENGGDRKTYGEKRASEERAYPKRENNEGGNDSPKRSFDKPFVKRDHTEGNSDNETPTEGIFEKPYARKTERSDDKPARPYDKNRKPADSRPFRERPNSGVKPFSKDRKPADGKPFGKPATVRPFTEVMNRAFDRPMIDAEGNEIKGKVKKAKSWDDEESDKKKKPFDRNAGGKKKYIHDHSEGRKKRDDDEDDLDEETGEKKTEEGVQMPLNKFIAHCGECSRRDAAELVKQGKVKVNGELVLDPGHKIEHTDKVTMSGKKLTPQKGMVYILLNKPKGFITTNDDPQGRRTVMDLVGNSGVERLFPVGRLDRDTSGLLLITNDGELTQKLCHPAYNVKKVYQVTLDKPVTKADFEKILEGVELEDGKAVVDALSYLEKKNELGLEIHSGKNRIVRRIFESLGYVVDKLDRVMYAGLTKKNLPRSKWRYLDEREVILLKHFKI